MTPAEGSDSATPSWFDKLTMRAVERVARAVERVVMAVERVMRGAEGC